MSKRAAIGNDNSGTTECYYCNAKIPDTALRCPSCGKVFSDTKKVAALTVAAIIIIAAISLGSTYLINSDGNLPWEGSTSDANDGGNTGTTPDDGGTSSDGGGETISNNPAPDFTLTSTIGESITLSDLRGKVVLLDFMATWCTPCEIEIGHLKKVYDKYSTDDVVILSIDVDSSESASLIQSYKTSLGAKWDFVRDTKGVSMESEYYATSIPTMVIVGRDGGIAARHVGVTDANTLINEIDPLL